MLYNLETPAHLKQWFNDRGYITAWRIENQSLRIIGKNWCELNIETITHNCSTVYITSVFGGTPSKHFMKVLAHWAFYADYTKFYFSSNFKTNSYTSAPHKKFIEEYGFEEVGEPYTSRRTQNIIQWYQCDILKLRKLLKDTKL